MAGPVPSVRACEVPNVNYWCYCRSYFSVKLGTVMQASNLPRTWAITVYRRASRAACDLKISDRLVASAQSIQRPGGVVHRREGSQQARGQEAPRRTGRGWKGCRGGSQGPGDQSDNRNADSVHGQGNASGIRAQAHDAAGRLSPVQREAPSPLRVRGPSQWPTAEYYRPDGVR